MIRRGTHTTVLFTACALILAASASARNPAPPASESAGLLGQGGEAPAPVPAEEVAPEAAVTMADPCELRRENLSAWVEQANLARPEQIAGILATGQPFFQGYDPGARERSVAENFRIAVRGMVAAATLAPIPVNPSRLAERPDAEFLGRLLRAAASTIQTQDLATKVGPCSGQRYNLEFNVQNWSRALRLLPDARPLRPAPLGVAE